MTNQLLHTNWWKFVGVGLVTYAIIGGFLLPVPVLPILNETVRCLHYHVPMWFGMIFILFYGLVMSIKYMRTFDLKYDIYAAAANHVAVIFGICGLVTGMFWAKFTWGEWWSSDPKQTASAIAMLLYLAYFVLRGAIEDEDKRAKVASVYNTFTFFIYNALIFVIPRLTDSLHPGNGGNPALSTIDLDSQLRLVFYPAVIGFIMIGMWMVSLKIRTDLLTEELELVD